MAGLEGVLGGARGMASNAYAAATYYGSQAYNRLTTGNPRIGGVATTGIAMISTLGLWVASYGLGFGSSKTATQCTLGTLAMVAFYGARRGVWDLLRDIPEAFQIVASPLFPPKIKPNNGIWENRGAHRAQFFDPRLADGIAALIEESIGPEATLWDFGCGEKGKWVQYLKTTAKLDCLGLDGNPHTERPNCVKDLSQRIEVSRFDFKASDFGMNADGSISPAEVVLCLEVLGKVGRRGDAQATQGLENQLLDNISNAADKMVILSWSNQEGPGNHFCKPPEYAIQQMEQRGWKYNENDSQRLRNKASSVQPWHQNVCVFYKKEE